MGKVKRNKQVQSRSSKQKSSILNKIDKLLSSWAYKRNRGKYLNLFKINDKYECEQPAEISGSAKNESSTLRSVYDVDTYPLYINGENCHVYESPNTLIINKTVFTVQEKDHRVEDNNSYLEQYNTKVMQKTILGVFSTFTTSLLTVKRVVSFKEHESLKRFICCLLVFEFEVGDFSTVLDTTSKECVFRIILSRKNVNTDIAFPVGLINKVIEETPVVEISFHNPISLPEEEQNYIIKKQQTAKLDDLYCFLYLRTQSLSSSYEI